jgi:ubiquinone/menaquinone biosynthesis C-methylase UbiE
VSRETTLRIYEGFYKEASANLFCRSVAAISLFDFLDKLRKAGFPPNWQELLIQHIDRVKNMFDIVGNTFDFNGRTFDVFNNHPQDVTVETKTGETYFQLWKDFQKQEYFAQTLEMLKERFDKNGLSVNGVNHVLDDGCGGGRYSMALKSLGAKKVTGIDISPNSVAFATKMSPFKPEEVAFRQCSVLEPDFSDGNFDFVFSNGVLHHTTDTVKGLKEIYRVLKKGGRCWLYLYGGKDSFFWDTVDLCRKLVLTDVPQVYVQTLMKVMGYPSGRIFHRADFFYVPINNRYFESEVDDMLRRSGFSEFKRLKRGVAHDWDEIIKKYPHIDPYIYGEGEMRYIVSK